MLLLLPPPLISLLLLALPPAASTENLSYRSPSLLHPHFAAPPPPLEPPHPKRTTQNLTFTHGIASGDPYANSVILWTRAVPDGVKKYKHDYSDSAPSACVAWEVASSSEFRDVDIVNSGQTTTSGAVDYTVKVEATELKPKSYYWYRFSSCDGGAQSAIGRTKTLPSEDDEVDEGVRFAVYSCSNWVEGFFNVYGMSARKDSVDYVLHLGDYIYEKPFPTYLRGRVPKPYKHLISLRDYRMRHALHKTDPDLLLSHQRLPWIAVWDDHEVADDGWRGGSASTLWQQLEFSSWDSRMQAGLRAYWEYMPLRQVAPNDDMRIWRSFKVGKLADLIMLDTRYYDRDRTDAPELRREEDRSIMGREQESWLEKTLAQAKGTWTLLGQQIQFTNINETAVGYSNSKDAPLYYDGWSGYAANRRRVLESIQWNNITNPVVLSGDYHTLWTAEITHDDLAGYNSSSGAGSLGVELAVTSVSSVSGYGGSLSYQESTKVARGLTMDNAFLKWAEGYYRGYFELNLKREELEAVYWAVPDVTRRSTKEREIARWAVDNGQRRFRRPFGQVKEGWLQKEEDMRDWARQGAGTRKRRL